MFIWPVKQSEVSLDSYSSRFVSLGMLKMQRRASSAGHHLSNLSSPSTHLIFLPQVTPPPHTHTPVTLRSAWIKITSKQTDHSSLTAYSHDVRWTPDSRDDQDCVVYGRASNPKIMIYFLSTTTGRKNWRIYKYKLFQMVFPIDFQSLSKKMIWHFFTHVIVSTNALGLKPTADHGCNLSF